MVMVVVMMKKMRMMMVVVMRMRMRMRMRRMMMMMMRPVFEERKMMKVGTRVEKQKQTKTMNNISQKCQEYMHSQYCKTLILAIPPNGLSYLWLQ